MTPLIGATVNYDEDFDVCESATHALEAIGTPQALAAVEAWKADPDNFDPEAFLADWEQEHGPSDG